MGLLHDLRFKGFLFNVAWSMLSWRTFSWLFFAIDKLLFRCAHPRLARIRRGSHCLNHRCYILILKFGGVQHAFIVRVILISWVFEKALIYLLRILNAAVLRAAYQSATNDSCIPWDLRVMVNISVLLINDNKSWLLSIRKHLFPLWGDLCLPKLCRLFYRGLVVVDELPRGSLWSVRSKLACCGVPSLWNKMLPIQALLLQFLFESWNLKKISFRSDQRIDSALRIWRSSNV